MPSAALRPPFQYFGAKTRLARKIVSLFPEHRHYVEPFAGSLAVLLAKPPSMVETVNDLDGEITCFWRSLRDHPEELIRACSLTPSSRAEYELCADRSDALDDVERARRVWVWFTQGRTGTFQRNGWRRFVKEGSLSNDLERYASRLGPVAARLKRVNLECRDALDVIKAHGRDPSTLLYVDPPYISETRKSYYRCEMRDDDQHTALAEALRACQAAVILSGYPSDLYDQRLYKDWHRAEFPAWTTQCNEMRERTEVVWSNRPLPSADAQHQN